MEPANILSERLETQERGIRELKFEKISGGGCPRTPLGAWALGARLGNRSVFILDLSLLLTYFVVRRGRFLSGKKMMFISTKRGKWNREEFFGRFPGYVNLSKVIFRGCD